MQLSTGLALMLVFSPASWLTAAATGVASPTIRSLAREPLQSPAPRDVTYCDLAANPRQFEKTRIRVTAFVNFAFENFTLIDPACTPPRDSDFSAWVAFGGDVPSGAVYCCPGEGGAASPARPARDAEFPLLADRTFRRFKHLLDAEKDTVVRGTFVGTLLVKPSDAGAGSMAGYGHFGCCSLFVIERVERFDDHNRRDLDYSSSLGAGEGRRCLSGRDETEYFATYDDLMRRQKEADAGQQVWVFETPERVALEAVHEKHGQSVDKLVAMSADPGRQVFEWRHGRSWTTIVVARPAWLSYFAKAKDVAWSVTRVTTRNCGFDIDPNGDIRAQVTAAFRDALGPPIVHPQLPPGWLVAGRVGGSPGPANATFYDVAQSHAVAVALDDDGWPNWVDVRPKDRYRVPAGVWDLPDMIRHVPMRRDHFEDIVVFLDAVRAMGSPRGAVRETRGLRTQQYEHATLVWEDGSHDRDGSPGAVRAFSVRWTQ